MCGIFGITAKQISVPLLLMDGLQKLSYRGYDSSGICLSILNKGLETFKSVGDVTQLRKKLPTPPPESYTGIGHTRWATHGAATDVNAHPILSEQSVAIVHNGIITNHKEIKSHLIQKGYHFITSTDTEVIAHLLHHNLASAETPLLAIEKTAAALKGRYAFVAILKSHPDHIFAFSHKLPLMVGQENETWIVSSDINSMGVNAKIAIAPSNEAFSISPNGCSLKLKLEPTPSKQEKIIQSHYPHITLHEIFEQQYIPKRIQKYLETKPFLSIPPAKKALLIACGSSLNCALLAKHWLQKLGITCDVETASELRHSSYIDRSDTTIIAISQSGETADTLICLEEILAKPHQHSITICNTPNSSMSRICDSTVFVQAGPEIGVASTKAVSCQLIILYLLSHHLASKPAQLDFASLQHCIEQSLNTPKVLNIAKNVASFKHIICIGKQQMLPIAKELALKLKELAYIHAEPLAAGELKHGPLALIDKNVLTIAIDDIGSPSIQTCISEIQTRGGAVITISPTALSEHTSGLEAIDELSAVITNIYCQLIAYYTALTLNHPIDKPRNLAKSVTVE